MNRLVAFVAAFSLFVFSIAAAFAQGTGRAHSATVICTGHGNVLIYLTADGNPTGPPELCDDALKSVASVAVSSHVNCGHPTTWSSLEFASVCEGCTSHEAPFPTARSPPLV